MHSLLFQLSGTVSAGLLVKLASIFGAGLVLYHAINGLKDIFPKYFSEHPQTSRVLNGVGSLGTALLVCVGGPTPTQGQSLIELGMCVGPAAITFLTASGLHQNASTQLKAANGAPKPVVPAPGA